MLVPGGCCTGETSAIAWAVDETRPMGQRRTSLSLYASAHGELCRPFGEDNSIPVSCPDFCCGSCSNQYCCSDVLKKIQWNEEMCLEPEPR